MKHAIILLSSYGKDYLDSAVSQFRNDTRFDIYIHLDKQSADMDESYKTNFMKKHTNVVWMDHLYSCNRFSPELTYIMADMLETAWKSKIEYKFYHLFSDSCRIIVPLNKFFNWFKEKGVKYDYIVKYLHTFKTHKYHDLRKASQWQTFSNKFIDYFFENNIKEKTKELPPIKYIIEKNPPDSGGALDEFFFPTAFDTFMCNASLNRLDKDLRLICWYDDGVDLKERIYDFTRPLLLSISIKPKTYIAYLLSKIKNEKYLIARKFDYKDNNSMEFLKLIRQISIK